jgi:hypothetical protein
VDGLLIQACELRLAPMLHHRSVHPPVEGSLNFRETRIVLVRSTIQKAVDDLIDSGILRVDDIEQIVIAVDIFAIMKHTKVMGGARIDVDRVAISSLSSLFVVLRQVRRAELVPVLHCIVCFVELVTMAVGIRHQTGNLVSDVGIMVGRFRFTRDRLRNVVVVTAELLVHRKEWLYRLTLVWFISVATLVPADAQQAAFKLLYAYRIDPDTTMKIMLDFGTGVRHPFVVDTGSVGIVVPEAELPRSVKKATAGSIRYTSSGLVVDGFWTEPIDVRLDVSGAIARVPVFAATSSSCLVPSSNRCHEGSLPHMLGVGFGRPDSYASPDRNLLIQITNLPHLPIIESHDPVLNWGL